jgi:hypothetical protein
MVKTQLRNCKIKGRGGLQISVRAGGHSVPGHSIADDALAYAYRKRGTLVSIEAVGDSE